jgi:putative ABC transport system ATP-binding protein
LSCIVRTENLCKDYRLGQSVVHAVRGVDLDVEKGESISIVGVSGSGKSTVLNLIGGLDRPSSGDIYVEGTLLSGLSSNQLAHYRQTGVGMIFQSFNLIPTMTAVQNVELPMVFSGVPRGERRERAGEWLRTVGLTERSKHKPGELSGGEQQRVAIARALVNEPSLLLADEPTGNLDSATAQEIAELLIKVNTQLGITLLLVTHNLRLAQACSNRIVRLEDGRIVGEIPVED